MRGGGRRSSSLWSKIVRWLANAAGHLAEGYGKARRGRSLASDFQTVLDDADAYGRARLRRPKFDIARIEQEIELLRAQAKATEADAQNKQADAELKRAQAAKLRDDIEAGRMERLFHFAREMEQRGFRVDVLSRNGRVGLYVTKDVGTEPLLVEVPALQVVASKALLSQNDSEEEDAL